MANPSGATRPALLNERGVCYICGVTRYDRRTRALAACLSALAGYIDAIGFIALGGFFVSFMSGNSTRLGVGLAEASVDAAVAAGLIATFVIGVVAGTLTGRATGVHRKPVVLILVTLCLALAAGSGASGMTAVAAAAMAFSMGAENAVFERDGEVAIGLTYMTGTLVKLGQRIAAALTGGDRLGWVPYLVHWLGLIAGAVTGATVYPRLGLDALWIAAGAAAVLSWVAARIVAGRAKAV